MSPFCQSALLPRDPHQARSKCRPRLAPPCLWYASFASFCRQFPCRAGRQPRISLATPFPSVPPCLRLLLCLRATEKALEREEHRRKTKKPDRLSLSPSASVFLLICY